MSKEIINKNSKGQLHGYQEWYHWCNGKLWYKGFYNNDVPIDYEEWYYSQGDELKEKSFHI